MVPTTSTMAKHLLRKHSIEPPSKEPGDQQQCKITSMETAQLIPIDSMPTTEKKRNDKLLARFIACSNVPTRIVDMEEFQNFVTSLNPTFILPSRPTIDTLLSDIYSATIEKIKSIIKNSDYISLSSDFWSIDRFGIYGIIANCYCKETQKKQCILLCLKYVKAPHTAIRILEETNQILNEFGIDGISDSKIVTISTDNGSNMKKAFAMDIESEEQLDGNFFLVYYDTFGNKTK